MPIKMTSKMRAKMTLAYVTRNMCCEELKFEAAYGNDPEDNTYAASTPSATLIMFVTNKALHGQFNPGDKFYVDFTPAT